MTLIRLVRAMPEPTVSVSPRVLGVEFALRKGVSLGQPVSSAGEGRVRG
jgi:hypothetical protein